MIIFNLVIMMNLSKRHCVVGQIVMKLIKCHWFFGLEPRTSNPWWKQGNHHRWCVFLKHHRKFVIDQHIFCSVYKLLCTWSWWSKALYASVSGHQLSSKGNCLRHLICGSYKTLVALNILAFLSLYIDCQVSCLCKLGETCVFQPTVVWASGSRV